MSLTCEEHGHGFKRTDALFCVTTTQTDAFTAVCRAAINAIPANLRSQAQIKGGVDIHKGYSTPYGHDGELSLMEFSLRERLSQSRERRHCATYGALF